MRARVIVFGREPIAGRVKTRLAAAIGGERAALTYRLLLEHTVCEAAATGLPVTLALADRPSAAWAPPAGAEAVLQSPGTLGERMADSFARAFAAGDTTVVLVGSDIPAISRAVLREAVAACRLAQVVLGPACDGGYYLVAQRAPGVDLFAGVPWSSRETLAATLARLRRLAVEVCLLPALADIDTAEDLGRAAADPEVGAGLRSRLRAVLAGG